MALPCGHIEACMYRYMYKGIRRKYCMACILEKHPEAEITPAKCNEYAKKQLAKQKEIKAKMEGREMPKEENKEEPKEEKKEEEKPKEDKK